MTTTNAAATLASYQNGNYRVTLGLDGTKTRDFEGYPQPQFPESLDLKITDWCDAGCAWCHEKSTVRGKHASPDTIFRMLEGLHPGVEIAIGGGDPLAHPHIESILCGLRDQGLICNVTVNGRHVPRHRDLVQQLRKSRLIYGLGISYHAANQEDIADICDPNTIVHFIAGVDSPQDARKLGATCPKMLILGYKHFGRGLKFYSPHVERTLREWNFWISPLMAQFHTCFDNLALEQLHIKDRIPENLWNQTYMGNDGRFTMYADAVTDQFAPSSTQPRIEANGRTAAQFFSQNLLQKACF